MRLEWMIFWIAASSLGVALATAPAAQDPNPLRIVGLSNAQIKFANTRTSRTVNFSSQLAGCWGRTFDGSLAKPTPQPVTLQPRVIDTVQVNGFWYVTLQVSLSGGCNVVGRCGAATTVNLIWVKLSNQLLDLRDQQVRVVQNCLTETILTQWVGRSGNDVQDATDPKLRLSNKKLELVFERSDYAAKLKIVSSLEYSQREFDKGLVVSSKRFALK